jgi:hypothetical protein
MGGLTVTPLQPRCPIAAIYAAFVIDPDKASCAFR